MSANTREGRALMSSKYNHLYRTELRNEQLERLVQVLIMRGLRDEFFTEKLPKGRVMIVATDRFRDVVFAANQARGPKDQSTRALALLHQTKLI
jgi:hypothetical protein